jgi:hypothetical protein
MPAVSEFTKAKIITLHQKGRYVVWANFHEFRVIIFMLLCGSGNTLGRWFGVQVLEEGGCLPWNRRGRGTERGTPELSPKSVPVHEE